MNNDKIKLLHEIQKLFRYELSNNGVTVHPIFRTISKTRFHGELAKTVLDIVTYNPKHDQHFLYHSVQAEDDITALKEMVLYIRGHQNLGLGSYTVEWKYKNDDEIYQSHFTGKNMESVLTKFNYGKESNSFMILDIKLNPES
jgi:hypothetical protein